MSINGVRALVITGILLMPGCESVQTRFDYDPTADFTGYGTFSWVAENPQIGSTAGGNPLTRQRIQRAVSETLGGKGYRFVEDPTAADFLVGFTVGARDRVRLETSVQPVGIRGPYGRWGVAYYQEVDAREYSEGRLAIDVFDVRLRSPVWHGYGTKSLTGTDERDPEGLIDRAVTAILANFPPGPRG